MKKYRGTGRIRTARSAQRTSRAYFLALTPHWQMHHPELPLSEHFSTTIGALLHHSTRPASGKALETRPQTLVLVVARA
jgi:hypothetical protein